MAPALTLAVTVWALPTGLESLAGVRVRVGGTKLQFNTLGSCAGARPLKRALLAAGIELNARKHASASRSTSPRGSASGSEAKERSPPSTR